MTLMKRGANRPGASSHSMALSTDACSVQRFTSYSMASHVLLNLLGSLVLAFSKFLQQICTSPTLSDVKYELSTRGDVNFGSNIPLPFLRRKNQKRLMLVWLLLVLSSAPLHLALNGITGYAELVPQYRGSNSIARC